MQGLNILADPMFGYRASPSQYMGPARYRPVPSVRQHNPNINRSTTEIVDELGLDRVDCVLISHNHFDHLDKGSVQALWAKYPEAVFLVPKGVEQWMVDKAPQSSVSWVSSCKFNFPVPMVTLLNTVHIVEIVHVLYFAIDHIFLA